jgi:serine/threonine protein kinase
VPSPKDKLPVDPYAPTAAPDATSEPAEEAPRVQIGRFRIEGSIGSGGMGEVYRAYDPMLERAVALKVLTSGADDAQRRRRLLREARAAAGLTHPNIVTIYEIGEADGHVFMAMELLEGESLREAIARNPPLETRLRWLLEAAIALGAAHQRGLVHRDVKPENMFVCEGGTLKLLDFGIAKRDEVSVDESSVDAASPSSVRTAAGRIVGTPRYMAPEQRACAGTDGRTDQYSWGLVAFELLTGVHALTAETASGPDDAIEVSSPRRAALLAVPGLPHDVAEAIVRTVALRMDDRFPSMAPLVALLEDQRDVEAARAATSPPPPRAWSKVGFVVGPLVVLAAFAGAARLEKRPAASPPSPPSRASAEAVLPCRAQGPRRAYAIGAADVTALLPGGSIVIGRFGASADTYEREVGSSLTPFVPFGPPHVLEHPRLYGASTKGKPSLVFVDRGMATTLWREGSGIVSGHRFRRIAGDVAVTDFGEGVAIVASGLADPKGWVAVHVDIPGALASTTPEVRRDEPLSLPAIAMSNQRLAITFAGRSLYFAYVDRTGAVEGDLLTVASIEAASTVGFKGALPLVFWIAPEDAGLRLHSAVLQPEGTAFAPPIVAIDQPVAATRPLAARLGGDGLAVFWVSATPGEHVVRMAIVQATGALGKPIDVARTAAARDLVWAPGPSGGDLSWVDDVSREVVAVRVACAN